MGSGRVGVDTGGTFTDLCFHGREGLRLAKVPSEPESPDRAVIKALGRLGLGGGEIAFFGHGTTVGLNALIERRGAAVGLITTQGFRDVLEIARFNRPEMYNLRYLKPRPLVPRAMRLEVGERVAADGAVLEPLDADGFRRAVKDLHARGAESIAVCFLNSYANPVHELAAARILREEYAGLTATVSADHGREWREYERCSTTVLNAYLAPRTRDYVTRLGALLAAAGLASPLLMMRCDGGLAPAEVAARDPVSILFSGPAAAVIGAAQLGRQAGFPDLVAVDIGGTSCDVSLIRGGQAPVVSEMRVEGFPVQQPFVDVHSIGAGGGTIAWIDGAGRLRVGPRSAGAVPGPACYGTGGAQPTVTDAYLVLGWVDPERFLGGELPLDRSRAVLAFEPLAARLGLDVERAACGVIRILNALMAAAVRAVSVEKGHDPRDFALMAFGGAGPLHAVALARELGLGRVVIPRHPSHLAALGILMADVRQSYTRTFISPWDGSAADRAGRLLAEMASGASAELRRQGFPGTAARFPAFVEMRYAGQEHTITVPLPGGLRSALAPKVEARFHRLHQRRFSFSLKGEPCELVAVRLDAVVPTETPRLASPPARGSVPVRRAERRVLFDPGQGYTSCPVYERDALPAGVTVTGPAIIEEPASNTVLPAGATAVVDPAGNIVVTL